MLAGGTLPGGATETTLTALESTVSALSLRGRPPVETLCALEGEAEDER